jgi:hypothetical protein
MFKELKVDCRRLPVRRGPPEQVIEANTPAEVEPAPAPLELKPKKKPRRQRVPKQIIEETPSLYDYPFVERLIEDEPAPSAAAASTEFYDYSFEMPAVEYRLQPQHEETPLAYVMNSGGEFPRESNQSTAGDYLRSRRA